MTTQINLLAALWSRGTDFLGSKYAILGGAMSWVSERNLVSAISNAGGFGVIACGSMTPKLLRTEILATKQLTKKPFGVNLITLHPQLVQLIEVCINEQVSHVVLAGALPRAASITSLKQAGIKVMAFAPALSIAKKLIKSGVDAIIIEGSEAGGHIGPISTAVLAQEILPFIREVPVFIAGGIGRGESIVSFLHLGASGCQLGTRFVCAHESIAHPNFKQAFIRASARDATTSIQYDDDFMVIPVRAIGNKATKEFLAEQKQAIQMFRSGEINKEEAQLRIERYWVGSLRRAVIDGDVEYGSLMAGQSVGMVTCEQSVQEILNELIDQAAVYLSKMKEI